MGIQRNELTVYGYVSRHNSDDDKKDDYLWDEFVARVRLISKEHKYESIQLDAFG